MLKVKVYEDEVRQGKRERGERVRKEAGVAATTDNDFTPPFLEDKRTDCAT
jgi:hypothetical protein